MSKQITFILTADKGLTTHNEGITIKELLGVACKALVMVRDQGKIPTEDILEAVAENLGASDEKIV